jgi:hypothetical protein
MSAHRPITTHDKYQCALRELKLRARVYSNRIETGRMRRAQAEHEYRVMRAIVSDYAEQLADADIPAEPPEPALSEGTDP